MKASIKRLVSTLLAVIVLMIAIPVGSIAQEAVTPEQQLSFTVRPVASGDSVEYVITDDNDPESAPLRVFDRTFAYKTTVTVNFDLDESRWSSNDWAGLYSEYGDPLIRAHGGEMLSYTLYRVKSDETIYFKILNSSGNPLILFGEDYSIRINIHIKDGFFDKFIAFFQEIFGLLPKEDWDFYYKDAE